MSGNKLFFSGLLRTLGLLAIKTKEWELQWAGIVI